MLTTVLNELHAGPIRKSPRRGNARSAADKTAPFITERPGWRLFSGKTGVKIRLINHLHTEDESRRRLKKVNDYLIHLFPGRSAIKEGITPPPPPPPPVRVDSRRGSCVFACASGDVLEC